MKESIKKVFQCDHCKRNMFVKHACIKHEDNCSKNPKNFHACGGCAYLQETEVEYWVKQNYNYESGGYSNTVRGFKCTKLDKELYPFKATKKGLPDKYPGTFEGKEQMPNECEHFEYIF